MEQLMPAAGASVADRQETFTLEAWQQAGKWFSYDGHAIFCRMAGQGEPLVLLHGYPTASWDWSRIWPMLARHYNLLTVDMLGFGFSDKPRNYHYSIEDQADLIQGWVEGLGLPGIHLLAHDYGSDRKSTRLNSSHVRISYAVFCLKKKKKEQCRQHE